MFYYKIYGMTVESDIELQEAYGYETDGTPQIHIHYCDMGEILKEIESVIADKPIKGYEDEQSWTVFDIKRSQSVLYYRNVGLFRISHGNLVEYMPMMDVYSPMFRQWILNMSLAIIKIQREDIIIHGSGLLMPDADKGFIISGDSGSGKSTLADHLLHKGFRFVADDVVAVEFEQNGIWIEGAYPTRRLCNNVVEQQKLDKSRLLFINDGNKEKYILDMHDAYYGEISRLLKAIFVITLGNGNDEVRLIEHKGSEKLNWISSNMYRKVSYQEMGITPKVFSKCLSIAQKIPIYEICRPVNKQTVEELADIVYKLMDEI